MSVSAACIHFAGPMYIVYKALGVLPRKHSALRMLPLTLRSWMGSQVDLKGALKR